VRARNIGILVTFGMLASSPLPRPANGELSVAASGPAAALSVMTYNVKGLPWPIAWGRGEALDSIGARLGALRAQGRQPHIVALQEAFTDEAKTIGHAAGYAYVANGPGTEARDDAPMNATDRSFASAARWSKGETQGKLVDSGLQILSDYPIVHVRRQAFPAFACAGYDCLANKGVLLVSIAVPGTRIPVDILDTHLNSRTASGVPDARSLYAYRRQVAFVGRFIAAHHDPASPLIMAGDYNMGPRPSRRDVLFGQIRDWSRDHGQQRVRDGLSHCMADSSDAITRSSDARWILKRARDWQFMIDGAHVALDAVRATVTFGHDANGDMLSDHIGFAVDYRLRRS